MKTKPNSNIRKGILITFLVYVLLTIIRFSYLQTVPQTFESHLGQVNFTGANSNAVANYSDSTSISKNNYASERKTIDAVGTSKQVSIDQKYERVGFISSYTDNFENDKIKANTLITENKGIIQLENNSGIIGKRVMELSIGVLPEKFDSFIEKSKGIGEVYDFRVEKRDKTSEYRDLKSKQLTLEKMRESLKSLKEKGGNINDLINLENKVLEVEEKIQNLGVSLGNFNEENELCTVKLNIYEKKHIKIESAISYSVIVKNIVSALIWTLGYYCGLLGMLILGGILTYLLLLVFNKFKISVTDFHGKKDTLED